MTLVADHAAEAARLTDRGNALFAAGDVDAAIDIYRAAIAAAPDLAALHFNLANALVSGGDFDAALESFVAAIARNPDDPGIRTNLGSLLRRLGRAGEALEEYRRAAWLEPRGVLQRYHVGVTLVELNRPAEALPWLEQALHLRRQGATNAPLTPAALETAMAAALLRLERAEEARVWSDAALAMEPRNAAARFGAGIIRLTLGDLAGGWPYFEARLEDPRVSVGIPALEGEVWRGTTDLRGRTLAVLAEQGAGDTIQFARYLPLLRARGIRVVLVAPASLRPLLTALVDEFVAFGEVLADYDAFAALMSLPGIFATDLTTIPADIPYLHVDPPRRTSWRRRLGRKRPRIGLVWSGNADHLWDGLRSIPLDAFAPLLAIEGVSFHALQPDCRERDLPAMKCFGNIRRHTLSDFADTAALVSLMDHCVAVDTAVAHLAGALGVSCDVLLQHAPDWRWMLGRDDTPWYPSLRLVRQDVAGAWAGPIATVAARVAAMVGA